MIFGKDNRMTFRLFEEFTHNAPVVAIDRGIADAFIDTLGRLPPNWGKSKETRKKTLAEVLKQSAKAETHVSNKTLNRHISAMSSLFKWAQRKAEFKYPGDNPFSNQWREEGSAKATRWLPYRVEELNKLFAGDPPPELRWIMLTALFSGMRLNEVCQLRVEDMQKEQGVPYFNVGAEHEGQRVKSEAGFRRVPIHSQLIKAGILDYAKALKPGQLWPGLKPGGPDRKLSWYVTRQFTVYRRKVGINRARVNFHSLRKKFRDLSRQRGRGIASRCCGHCRA
jgi:integrase